MICFGGLGEASVNLTTLYDIVTEMSQQLKTVTKELEETKKKLNETERKLKLGNTIELTMMQTGIPVTPQKN